MTKYQKELMEMSNLELVDTLENIAVRSGTELERHFEANKKTLNHLKDCKAEIIRRLTKD